MHNRCIDLPTDQYTVIIPRRPKLRMYDYVQDACIAFPELEYKNECYTQRRAVLSGRLEVIYWAHSSKENYEALDMLLTYMLRGAKKL